MAWLEQLEHIFLKLKKGMGLLDLLPNRCIVYVISVHELCGWKTSYFQNAHWIAKKIQLRRMAHSTKKPPDFIELVSSWAMCAKARALGAPKVVEQVTLLGMQQCPFKRIIWSWQKVHIPAKYSTSTVHDGYCLRDIFFPQLWTQQV